MIPYTGNEFKRIDDLQIWGVPGQIPMVWSRHSNSRLAPGMSWFGLAHYWRHSFQWELTTTDPGDQGQRGADAPRADPRAGELHDRAALYP